MRRGIAVLAAVGAVGTAVVVAPAAHAEGRGDIRVVKTVVNAGGSVIVGVKNVKRFPIVMTVKDDSGVKDVAHVSAFNATNGHGPVSYLGTSCRKSSSTTSVCTATMEFDPSWIDSYGSGNKGWDANAVAGTWQVNATVRANDKDYWISDRIATFRMKRAATLTTDAAPEPVKKGGTLTVTGKLSRANWTDLKYHAFTGQVVKLQYKKPGGSYHTVKTATTDSKGHLRTTVKASASGGWRWAFLGTTTTMKVVSTGDAVTLK
ncbi:hypothetical protein [Streptomyces sp. HB132]|uniref:hypothetical protein n=1 Tax=Streptomyces sp. HB132 TaxID=767388 RepID=UPI001960484C|nr:hypothetical protein [Streptomyces sp. HB132]MBM7437278.1 hypothetical protein [Streptomyces sp. HB132]